MSEVVKLLFAFLFAVTPPCQQEDDTNCHWSATVQGNGNGYDFVTVSVGTKEVVLRGEWHGTDTRGRTKRDYPRAIVRTTD